MKAMILAAGRGKRMGELTLSKPKPLLEVAGIALLENKILTLKQAGITDFVINVAYLSEKIKSFAGDGSKWNVKITYSEETSALETAGGICKALHLLGEKPFVVVNADIWMDYPLSNLTHGNFIKTFEDSECLGHLILVKNPKEKTRGDFDLNDQGKITELKSENVGYTFSGLALYKPVLFETYPNRRDFFPLLEVFNYAIKSSQLSGEVYSGLWSDIGTPERLNAINKAYG